MNRRSFVTGVAASIVFPVFARAGGVLSMFRAPQYFNPGEFTIIAGRPGTGKTAFLCELASEFTSRGLGGVKIFSAEMTKRDYVRRLEKTGYNEALIDIDDEAAPSPDYIRESLTKTMLEKKVGVVFVDYLQLMRFSDVPLPRSVELSSLKKELKLIAQEYRVPVIVASQMARIGKL